MQGHPSRQHCSQQKFGSEAPCKSKEVGEKRKRRAEKRKSSLQRGTLSTFQPKAAHTAPDCAFVFTSYKD